MAVQPPLVVPKDSDFARWSLISNTHLATGGITLGLTDFLDPYPDLTIQVIMLAGCLPYLTDAIVPAAEKAGIKDPFAHPSPQRRSGSIFPHR